jgi:tetratricopeptide (TPR) repeat protein
LALAPHFTAAHGNRGKTLQTLGRFNEALDAYRKVMALEPDSAQVYVNASHSCLILGQFEQGFTWYEWRKRLPDASPQPQPPPPLWLGTEDIAGKTLLLHGEQGLGDSIQFSRYARLVLERGAKVTLVVPERLVRLLSTLGQGIEVRAEVGLTTSGFDYHCPLPSLPLAFRTRLHTIPAAPYLSAEPTRVARWRAAIGRRGFKIGIIWQGNPNSPADCGRSPPLRLFESIATLPDVRLISLQRGAGIEQLSGLGGRFAVETMPAEFDQGSNAFLDSAALMESLDLVITSDTAAAHLAGALGRPTWLVLQHVPDWRWLVDRRDCPWYPSMQLFRQAERGGWKGVFDAMRTSLAAVLKTP